MSENKVLEIRGVSKNFGGVAATDNVNIEVARGEIFGIIGPNGAGKTTLFNLITGIYQPTAGDILFEGESIVGKEPHWIAAHGIARTFQNIRLFNTLSVYSNARIATQNIMDYGFLQGVFKGKKYKEAERLSAKRCQEGLVHMGLWGVKDQISGNLPYGQQRRLEIVRALMTSPRLLLLDEPAAGMNEEESEELSALIRSIRDENEGLSIVVIDHHMDVIMSVCDRITVINFGRQIATGTPEEIQSNDAVIEAYLGAGD